MKIFLTGGTGVIGRHTLRQLVADGHDVSVVARSPDKAAEIERAGGVAIAVSLFDADALATAVVGHDAVVNLATNIPPMAKAARAKAWETNDRIRTEGVANLLAAADAAGAARFVQESVTFPYLDGGDSWIDESAACDGGPSLESINTAEQTAATFPGDSVVLRFAQFYDPASSHSQSFVAMAKRGLNPFLGDPDGYTSLIDAADAANAVVASLSAPAGIYNVAETTPATRAALGQQLARLLGRKRSRSLPHKLVSKVNAGVEPLTRSHRISSAKLVEATGWVPQHPDPLLGWQHTIEAMA